MNRQLSKIIFILRVTPWKMICDNDNDLDYDDLGINLFFNDPLPLYVLFLNQKCTLA